MVLGQLHGHELATPCDQALQLKLLGIGQRLDQLGQVATLNQRASHVGQHAGIDAIGLGQVAHGTREVARLARIDHCHRQPCQLQRRGAGQLEAAGGLEQHQPDVQARQLGQQHGVSRFVVGKGKAGRSAADGHLQRGHGYVDAHGDARIAGRVWRLHPDAVNPNPLSDSPLMHGLIKNLTDDEIVALAAYLESK